MANFGKLIITNKGKEVDAKIKADESKTLKFTKVEVGDGELGGQKPEELTALISMKHDITPFTVSVAQNNMVRIGFEMTNYDDELTWREVGIFVQDPDTQENVLYVYGNAGTGAETIARRGGADVLEKFVNIDMVVDNASQISVELGSSLIYVTEQEFQEKTKEIEGKIDSLSTDYEDLTSKPSINSVELSGNKTTTDLNISHNDLQDIPTINGMDVKDKKQCEDYGIQRSINYMANQKLLSNAWMDNHDGTYYYLVSAKGVTENHVANVYLDLENQAKLTGGYTETVTDGVKIITSEQPTEEITCNIEVAMIKPNT